MFELTVANWPTACGALAKDFHEGFIVYAVLHKLVFGFAVVGITNGISIQGAFKFNTLNQYNTNTVRMGVFEGVQFASGPYVIAVYLEELIETIV